MILARQPRPQGLLLIQNGGRRWLQKFVRISSRKHDEMSSFCLNKGFRLQKTNRAPRCWKQPPKRPFHHVSRDKILHDSWSISVVLARVSQTAIFNEEKALGTRLLVRPSYRYKLIQVPTCGSVFSYVKPLKKKILVSIQVIPVVSLPQ